MNTFKVLGVTASVIMSSALWAKTNSPVAKNLAGPAEEIELMQLPDPASTAILSKHAMLKIGMPVHNDGQSVWQKNILIDGENPKVLLFSPDRQDWDLTVRKAGTRNNSFDQDIHFQQTETQFGMAREQFPATQFDLANLAGGRYQFNISSKSTQATEGYILVSSDSPYQLSSYTTAPGYLVGQPVVINARAQISDQAFSVVKSDLGLIQSSYLSITSPDGVASELSMFDDGLELDKAASDGTFNGSFVADQPGLYQVQVVVQGMTPEGKPFFRTAEHVVPVVERQLELSAKHASGVYTATNKIELSIPVEASNDEGRYRVFAEVWSQNKGQESAVSWLSTISDVSAGQLTLQLDDRWLMKHDLQGSFVLKNIRVEELDYYINVLSADQLRLDLPNVSEQAKSAFDGQLTQSMLMGDRPQRQANKAGGKLMLVHGYCSGDAWGPVQSQFSNSVKFTDFNQNRSHDQFARLIDSYGDNFPSFGVVAHSQGGAASLHLYTYYWSGLDYADPGRLIQSVGTPYQGTPLAGNLALIGDIFGVGCGYNGNLTTSGASAWLSGIPTWARSKVNYYTTSFTDKWWRYDYCNIASDLVLSDPEDGTTEKSRGQLSGASNRGHKTGQCHTTGMRDMAQTRDSGRNGTMSANAAR